jgi:hypothetical protein
MRARTNEFSRKGEANGRSLLTENSPYKRHVAGALHRPFVILFQQQGADQPGDSSSHNVATFNWYVLLERGNLRARYGEGFRGGLTGQRQGAPGQPQESTHGPTEGRCGVAGADELRGVANGGRMSSCRIRAVGSDPVPTNPDGCSARESTHRRARSRAASTQER